MPECKEDRDPCDILPVAGEAWNVCLPFGGRIWSDGVGVHAQGGNPPPDGVYGKVVIANGCLVGVEPEDVPLYTGSPCSPLPGGCGGSEGGSSIGPGFTPGNTTVTCSIEAGSGVSVSGSGTDADPYVISAENGVYVRSENAAITITGAGTRANPFSFKHKAGLATTVNGMTFDAFGHLTNASTGGSAGSSGVKGIVPGFGIAVNMDNASGIATISQQQQPASVPGDYQLGGFNITVDKAGQVSAVKQQIRIDGAPIRAACGTTDLTINQYGSVTAIADTMNLGASFTTAWGDGAGRKSARFTMRCSSALAGICMNDDQEYKDLQFSIDGQKCDKIGNMFWASGIFLAGQHTLEVTGGSGSLAVMLYATTMMEPM